MKILLLLPIIALCAGCVKFNSSKQTLSKQTVFGLQIASNPSTGIAGLIPQIQFGLIRNQSISNPTSTNPVYAAPLSADVDATVGLLSQKVKENQSFGK